MATETAQNSFGTPKVAGCSAEAKKRENDAHRRHGAHFVAERLEHAAEVMRCLPGAHPRSAACAWPEMVSEFVQDDAEPGSIAPTPDDIARMDEALLWLHWVSPSDSRLLWARAEKIPWRKLSARLRVSRQTLWARWASALAHIASKLDANIK